MKKWSNIAVLAILVSLMACTKVENGLELQESISYSVASYVTSPTKTGELNLKDDENVTSFRSKAWVHANGAAAGEVYFNETVSWQGNEWAPSQDYFWPKHPASYVNFVSWYDAAGVEPSTVEENNLAWSVRNINANDNVLVARAAWRQNGNMLTYGNNGISGGVPTLFRHMLTRISVNMKASPLVDPEDNNDTYEVTLQSARLEGVYQRGALNLTTNDPGSKGTSTWSNASAPYYWTSAAGSNATPIAFTAGALGTTPTSVLAERSIMPQEITSNIRMVIVYSVTCKSNGVTTSVENDIPATVVMNKIKNTSDVAITQWLPNTKYVYNITINPVSQEILLNPTVESDWSSGFDTQFQVTVE